MNRQVTARKLSYR